jgi:hypothetical protein
MSERVTNQRVAELREMADADLLYLDDAVDDVLAAFDDLIGARRELDMCYKLLDAALGDGPECDCEAGAHACGWPQWEHDARALLNAAREEKP